MFKAGELFKGMNSKHVPIPVTLIDSRDCFVYDLKFTEELMKAGERTPIVKKQYYFRLEDSDSLPSNFRSTLGLSEDADLSTIDDLKVGVTCYENVFTTAELDEMERQV